MKKGEGIYNVVVIGAGTAGLVTAAGTAGLGGRVALIERYKMGGGLPELRMCPEQGAHFLGAIDSANPRRRKMGIRSTRTAVYVREDFRSNAGASREDCA